MSGATERESDAGAAPPATQVAFAVGVATRNQAGTIGPVLGEITRGLHAAFPSGGVLLQADCGSQDDTVERARAAVPPATLLTQLAVQSDGLAAPVAASIVDPAALRCLLEEARRIDAPGCAVLDAQVGSLPAGWIERLARPIVEDQVDVVAPYYLRHPFDGTLTSGIAYPLQRALYGKQIRYPLGTDFACSRRFLTSLTTGKGAVWPPELARVGCEAWLLTRAMAGEFRIGQAFLGVKDAPTGESVGNEVTGVLSRVLSALFLEMERQATVWQKVRRSVPAPLFGAPVAGSPEPRAVDLGRALESFRLGQRNLPEIWSLVLSPAELLELAKLARRSDDTFRMPDGLWARVVYDFALAHRLRVMNREHLLAAFVPLYLGWLAGFALELGEPDPVAAERRIEELCLRFESEKPYLIARWRWPDRFTP